MLFLETTGYGYSKRLCQDVVLWFVSKYLPRHKLEIEVLHRGLKKELVVGWCDIFGRTYNPREFLIEIQSNLDKETYITTLFHELWHLYQFVNGDLKLKSSKKYYKGICMEDIDYSEQGHEKEAYKMESKLYQEYIKYLSA